MFSTSSLLFFSSLPLCLWLRPPHIRYPLINTFSNIFHFVRTNPDIKHLSLTYSVNIDSLKSNVIHFFLNQLLACDMQSCTVWILGCNSNTNYKHSHDPNVTNSHIISININLVAVTVILLFWICRQTAVHPCCHRRQPAVFTLWANTATIWPQSPGHNHHTPALRRRLKLELDWKIQKWMGS